jgi:hypothetical protein
VNPIFLVAHYPPLSDSPLLFFIVVVLLAVIGLVRTFVMGLPFLALGWVTVMVVRNVRIERLNRRRDVDLPANLPSFQGALAFEKGIPQFHSDGSA